MTVDSNVLLVPCPFCHTQHWDELECFDSGHVDMLVCSNEPCGEQFWFSLQECAACGAETVFAWKQVPRPSDVRGSVCHACGASFDDSRQEAESEDSPGGI